MSIPGTMGPRIDVLTGRMPTRTSGHSFAHSSTVSTGMSTRMSSTSVTAWMSAAESRPACSIPVATKSTATDSTVEIAADIAAGAYSPATWVGCGNRPRVTRTALRLMTRRVRAEETVAGTSVRFRTGRGPMSRRRPATRSRIARRAVAHMRATTELASTSGSSAGLGELLARLGAFTLGTEMVARRTVLVGLKVLPVTADLLLIGGDAGLIGGGVLWVDLHVVPGRPDVLPVPVNLIQVMSHRLPRRPGNAR